MVQSFSTEIVEKLKTYVYRLIDPRNGETFYVGKGKGNRVFQHCKAAIQGENPGDKLNRIREIINGGFEVSHVIHRHGMSESTAFEVEAALIDAYPGLTNEVSGSGSNEFGAMHAQEIVTRYQAEPAVFTHRVILINVNRSASDRSLYDATRYTWKINPKKAARAEYILAVRQGLILGVFVAEQWLPDTTVNFPGRVPVTGRYGFVGRPAPEEIRTQYIGKSVPDRFRKRGAANPIKYSYK